MHKTRYVWKWLVEISVEELDWPEQSPDLNPIEHFWNELERRLRARPNGPTSVLDLTNALVPTSTGKPPQKSGDCYSVAAERGPTSY